MAWLVDPTRRNVWPGATSWQKETVRFYTVFQCKNVSAVQSWNGCREVALQFRGLGPRGRRALAKMDCARALRRCGTVSILVLAYVCLDLAYEEKNDEAVSDLVHPTAIFTALLCAVTLLHDFRVAAVVATAAFFEARLALLTARRSVETRLRTGLAPCRWPPVLSPVLRFLSAPTRVSA